MKDKELRSDVEFLESCVERHKEDLYALRRQFLALLAHLNLEQQHLPPRDVIVPKKKTPNDP